MTDKETIARLEFELLAERQRAEQAEQEHDDIAAVLVTANETIRQLAAKSHERRDQLLSALAAIEKHNKDAALRAQWEKEHEHDK